MTVAELVVELLKLDQVLPVCQQITEEADYEYFDTLTVRETECRFDDGEETKYDANDEPILRKCVALEYM